MVPFEYRAADSLFFVRPNVEDIQKHAKECHGYGICWDLILSSMKTLNDKYGAGFPLASKNSFCDLVRSVIGSDDDVFPVVMTKLGKVGAASSEASSGSLWRRLPTSVDIEEVHKAYATFKSDLQSEALRVDFRSCPEVSDFLQLLNCNFQPSSLTKQAETSVAEREAISLATTRPSAAAATMTTNDVDPSLTHRGLSVAVEWTPRGTVATPSGHSTKSSARGAGGPVASVQLLQEGAQTASHPTADGQFDDAE